MRSLNDLTRLFADFMFFVFLVESLPLFNQFI